MGGEKQGTQFPLCPVEQRRMIQEHSGGSSQGFTLFQGGVERATVA